MLKNLINKKCLIAVLVFTVMLSFSSPAASQTSPFNDLGPNHWCFKDIVKMNARGVVGGYNDGSFKPERPVSQLEAVLMAVHNMGIDLSAVNADQPLPVSVPAWAENGNKREIIVAVQRGLIVPDENNFNATASASRAWVAQLMVRMINKNYEASQSTSQSLPFKDADLIPSWAVGYVDTAFRYKLLSGYPDNSFRPNQTVTRAEMVSMLSRSEQYLNLGDTMLLAKVVDIAGQNMTVAVGGTAKTVSITNQTWVLGNNGQVLGLTNINKNDAVRLVLNGLSVKYIEVLPANTVMTTVTGTVIQVLTKEQVLVIRDDQQRIITSALSAYTTVSSQAGDVNDLSQIAVGDKVELQMDVSDTVVSVLLLNQGDQQGSTDIIYNIDTSQKLIMLKNSAGKYDTYQYSDLMVVNVPNKGYASVNDLHVGDEVKITLASGVVSQIDLVQAQKQLTVSGKVMIISQEKDIITIQKDDGSLAAFTVSSDAVINISGVTSALLSSVLVNDQVDLMIEDGQVTSIEVKDRNTQETVTGTVTAIDTGNRILTIKTDDDELKVYEVSEDAEFNIDGDTTSYLSHVKKDMKVKLRLLDDKVIYLENKNTVEGSVISVDKNLHLITIASDSMSSRSYRLSDSVDVNIKGKSSPDLGDINRNDYVELRVEDSIVTDINVRTIINYEVTKIYSNSNEIKVKEDDGDTSYLTFGNSVSLTVPGITYPNIDDLQVGDVVKATFYGSNLSAVEVTPVVRGQITAVNTYLNTVTVMSFTGTSTIYNFTNTCEIVKDGQHYSLLSTMAVGDRVEIKARSNGGTAFNVLTKMTGKFMSYNSSSEKFYIAKDPMNWTSYDIGSDVYVHSGYQTLTLNNLLKDDNIDIYLSGGTICEIEKK